MQIISCFYPGIWRKLEALAWKNHEVPIQWLWSPMWLIYKPSTGFPMCFPSESIHKGNQNPSRTTWNFSLPLSTFKMRTWHCSLHATWNNLEQNQRYTLLLIGLYSYIKRPLGRESQYLTLRNIVEAQTVLHSTTPNASCDMSYFYTSSKWQVI